MLASERVLGPRWSQKELRTFYILLKAYGRQWERLEERLPSRTNAMIRALFDMHRGYLSLPEASAEGFCTIMTDHYKSLDELRLEQEAAAMAVVAAGPTASMASATDGDTHGPPGPAMAMGTPRPLPPPPPLTLPSLSKVAAVDMTPPPPSVVGRSREDTPPSDTRTKKKRKLERFLARDESMGQDRPALDDHVQDEPTDQLMGTKHVSPVYTRHASARKPAKPTSSTRRGNWLRDTDRFPDRKFDLPWCYWFYSFVDVDFFNHNEFVECLQRMQLGNLVKAARPIWSSVRASMGHPRRLSPRFLVEEKQKLEHYREVKRRADSTPQSTRWPYKMPIALAAGLRVLAQLAHPPRFVSGTIEHFSVRDGVCKIRLDNNGRRVCSLDAIMILAGDHGSASERIGSTSLALDGSSSSKLSSLALLEQAYQDKLAAIALVRDLLKRKELLVNAMAKMNVQARILRYDFSTNNCVADNTLSDETLFQRQYAWLVVNLDVTNRYLRAALLRLQDVSRVPKISSGSGSAYPNHTDATMATTPVHSSLLSDSYHDDRPAMLTLEHMRWAVNFLTLSRKRTSELVAAETGETPNEAGSSEGKAAADDQDVPGLSVETKDLVANCLSLASVIRRGSSASIPPLITQKLMERMFELLAPRFESNMDLYAELRSAAEGVAMMQRQTHHQGSRMP